MLQTAIRIMKLSSENNLEEPPAMARLVPFMPNKKNPKIDKSTESDPAKTSPKDSRTWSLRPDDDVRRLVDLAMKATGEERQTLIFECVIKELPNIVERLLKDRQALEDELAEHIRDLRKK